MQETVCTFKTRKEGRFDGLHMHLVIDLDEEIVIDVYRERTTWNCTYVRLFDTADAMTLPQGALIECTCHVDAASHLPAYSIRVRVSADGQEASLEEVANCSWEGNGWT